MDDQAVLVWLAERGGSPLAVLVCALGATTGVIFLLIRVLIMG